MSVIPNKHKFLLKTIEDFFDKSIKANKPKEDNKPNFRPTEFYSHGHCAEYAYNLAKYAKSKGVESEVTIMFSDIIDRTGKRLSTRLSHVIVELEGNSYDVCSWDGDARRTWFLKTNCIDSDESNKERKWRFLSVSTEDMNNVYKTLKSHCDKHGVPFCDIQLDKDYQIFDSLKKKTKERGYENIK